MLFRSAVEAARAGEAGAGFAVVADEVRTLAQRSAAAARDTEQLIQESIERTHHGKGCLDTLLESMRSITGATQSVADLVGSVRAESSEQAKAMRKMGDSLNRIEDVTRSTASRAEESTVVASELRHASESLDQAVARLFAMFQVAE